jgi:cold shock protein
MSNKLSGFVKKWIDDRGFGFIKGDDGEDYFLHIRVCQASGIEQPKQGDRLAFLPKEGPQGKRAGHVEIAEAA